MLTINLDVKINLHVNINLNRAKRDLKMLNL